MANRVIPALLLTLTLWPTACPADDTSAASVKTRYEAARRIVDDRDPYDFLADKPSAFAALDAEWVAAGDWIALYLDSHPKPAPDEVQQIVNTLDSKLSAE